VIQLVVSVRRREELRVPAGDPWDGRSLEWCTAAPPPEYNFPVLPAVTRRDAFMHAKETGRAYVMPESITDIKMPKNSAMGFAVCIGGGFLGFGLVWHIWWLCVAALLALCSVMIGRVARDTEKIIPAAEVKDAHRRWLAIVAASRPVTRAHEIEPANHGRAVPALLEAAE
jgi:cytochrome o ubiquinol oxidase subunit I